MNTTDEKTITNGNINEAEAQKIMNPQSEVKKSENTWKRVALGNGLAGIALGAAGFFLGEDAAKAETISSEETEAEIANDSQAVIKGDAPVASGDYEEMSFSDAFEAAREEVGAGGVFQWHGQLYGTYYATEWDAMTDEQKEQYFHSVYGANAHHAEDQTEEVADNNAEETAEDKTDAAEEDLDQEQEAGLASDEVSDNLEGNQVNVLNEEVVETEEGAEVGVISAEVDGHYTEFYDYDNDGTIEAALVDSNDDGIADVAMVDENGDGAISEDEVYSVDDDAMSAGTSTEDALYGDSPDYVNDADTSAF